MQRRRTNSILALVLLVGVLFGLVGTIAVVASSWDAACKVLLVFVALSIATWRFLDQGFATGIVLGGILTLLVVGAYALHAIIGVPPNVAVAICAGFVVLLGVITVRSMIAGGSADYPYDDRDPW